jgi:predicted glycosyltransferase
MDSESESRRRVIYYSRHLIGLGHPRAVGSQQQQLCGIRVAFDARIKNGAHCKVTIRF